jgi:membrane-associated phospholipid phosphatase
MAGARERHDQDPASTAPPAGLPGHLPLPAPRPSVAAPVALLLGLAAIAGLWAAFTGVGPAQLDGHLLGESIRSRSDPLTAAAVTITNLGSTVSMAVLAGAEGVWLWCARRRADAALAVGTMASASVVFNGLKDLLDRPRPPHQSRLVDVANESLPSGHATMSIVVIGALVVLAWPGRSPTGRAVLVGAGALCVGAIGLTRIYLGVHWFSDVLAGWLVGGAWLALCVVVWSWWRTRRASKSPGPMSRAGAG